MAASLSPGGAKKVTSVAGQPAMEPPGEPRATTPRSARARTPTGLRLPIAFKFTLFIGALVVACTLWQTVTAIRTASSRLDHEINERGVLLVSALATLINPEWVENMDNQQKLISTLQAFVESPGAEQARVLNAVVFNAAGAAVATARAESTFHRTAGRPIADASAPGALVTILEFAYDGVPVRSFARPIGVGSGNRRPEDGAPGDGRGLAPPPDAGAGGAGRIEVYISAAEIEDSRQELTSAMTAVSVAACIGAALGAFLLARFLTRPIRILLRDMRQVTGGDLRHESKVLSSDELGDLGRAFNAMTSSLQAAQEAKLAQKALEQELSIATEIQTRLLPASIPQVDGFEIAAYYVSAKEVGGDYYDFVQIDERHLGLVVADVSGKSVPGALIMTMTRSLLRLAAEGENSPARTVQVVNRVLAPDVNPGMFVTLVYIVLELSSREAKLVRCGHNAPLLWSARHGRILRLKPRGIALCLDRGGTLFQSELQVQRFTIAPGDVLVCYTDGVVEAKSKGGEDYGEGRLSDIVAANARASARELVEAIVKDVSHHRRGAAQSDDLTLLVVKGL